MDEYTVEIGGIEHTIQLSEEDAKRLNASRVVVTVPAKVAEKSKTASNKARTVSDK
jgi:hypothetical protein